jgi:hypothetical protein
MSDLTTYQAAEGYSDEQMAAMLSDKLGRAISATGYKVVKGRRDVPAEWLSALSIAPQEPSGNGHKLPSPPTPSGDERQTEAPLPPSAAVGVLPFNPQSAHMQITLAYTMAGKGAALAMRSPQVSDVWSSHAPRIADAYIAWAKEDATVARWINILTLGGPKGDLVQLHASMIITTLIVGGKVNGQMLVPPSMRTPEETDTIGELPDDDELEPDDTPPAPPPRPRKPRPRK